ncbi:MAG: hypothetical protein ACI30N_03960 [Muribaculaceae bacterium]
MARKSSGITNSKWEGYTLEELRCQRALVQARIIVAEHDVDRNVARLKTVLTGGHPNMGRSTLGRMLSALSYIDWAIIGITLVRKVAPFFSHRKDSR